MAGQRRAAVGAIAALAAAALAAAVVIGGRPADRPAPEPSVVADDALVLDGDAAQAARAVRLARHAGADWLRVTASPGDGPERRAALDRAFALATGQRLRVMVDLAPGGPALTPGRFGAFAGDLARRYSGRTAGQPAAAAFAVGDGRHPPGAYRRLLYAAVPAIRRAAPGRPVLIGNTTSAAAPLAYLRAVACVSSDGRPLRSDGCAAFAALPGDGWAHRVEGTAGVAGLEGLVALLRTLRADGRLRRPIAIHLTGYSDTDAGGPYEHARGLGEAEWIARHTPGVHGFGLEPLRDRDTRAGLQTADGAPRPALAAFARTLLVRPAVKGGIAMWGHVRTQTQPERFRVAMRMPDGSWRPLPLFNRAHHTNEDRSFAVTARTAPGGRRIGPGDAFRLELLHAQRWRPAGLPLFGARPPLSPAAGSSAG